MRWRLPESARPARCAFHALRIQAAFPLFGIDITQDNLAQEAGRTQQAISFTKGCYLGQEPIARIDALGHINKIVACLQVETTDPMASPAEVHSIEGSRIGQITSAVPLPGTDHSLAMATIRTSHAAPGTPLQVAHTSGTYHATTLRANL